MIALYISSDMNNFFCLHLIFIQPFFPALNFIYHCMLISCQRWQHFHIFLCKNNKNMTLIKASQRGKKTLKQNSNLYYSYFPSNRKGIYSTETTYLKFPLGQEGECY